MEDYEDFLQHHLSQLRQCEENRPSRKPVVRSCSRRSPSLISFYAQPILPPLLSEQQREEVHRIREALQRTTDQRKSRAHARVTYVENILNNVQVLPLRTTPTVDKFLNEEQGLIESQSSPFRINTNVSMSQSDDVIETSDSLTTLPTSSLTCDGVGGATSSSLCSAFSPHNLTPHQHYQEEGSVDHYGNKLVSQPAAEPLIDISHQSISSGYVTYVNAGSTTSHSAGLERRGESHGFRSEEEANGFFLHNTSNTITNMQDIISHPPIDGEELERCAEESSVHDHCLLKDICSISPFHDSIIHAHSAELASTQVQSSPTGVSESTPMLSPELKDIALFTQKDKNQDGDECPVTSVKTSCPLDSPESSETLVTHCPSTAHQPPVQVQQMEMEPQDDQVSEAETKSPEEPCPPSLQVLLKRSQEYRRCQRMLRNQAKNAKTQERSQQVRKGEERDSLSDKENDEFPHKGALATEGRKIRDKAGNKGNQVHVSSSLNTSPKGKVGVIHVTEESQEVSATFKLDDVHLIGVEETEVLSGAQEDDASGNTPLHCTPEVRAEQPCNTFSISTDNGVGKFQTVPILQFCMSPVHCKSKAQVERVIHETTVPKTKPADSTSHNVNDNAELKVIFNNEGPPTSSILYLAEEGDVERMLSSRRSSDQAQQIDQLKFNLSSLKLLITDLEATITENMENGCQIQTGNPLGHFTGKDIESINKGQLDRNYQEERDGQWQRRPLKECKNKDMVHESSPNVSWQESLNEGGGKLMKITATEKLDVKGTGRGEEPASGLAPCRVQLSDRVTLATDLSMISFRKHETVKKQQPCITSMAQRMHVPDVFRRVPSEIKVSHTGSVLLDTSNQQMVRKSEMMVVLEGEESSHSLSLNQSYDVDTPSGLWLQLGSRSDSRSKGHNVQGKNLTPESGGEGHGGISKAKRRLLMHVTEGSEDRPRDGSRGAVSILRPHSSTSKDLLRWHEGHSGQDDEQQLKPAYESLHNDQRKQLELLQALAVRYHLLQSVSFPCPLSSSRLGDVSISPSLLSSTFSSQLSPQRPPPTPQFPSSVPDCYRPLVLAAVKGFLTRRLLKTERVAQLLRTIKDTRQFLLTFQPQTPGRGIQTSRQDILLLERVTLQLRSARYELYDIFFSLSARERMQLISWDRELVREREQRRQSGDTVSAKGKTSLSPATQKSLERKRGVMIQKKATGSHRVAVNRTRHKTERPSESKRGQFKANPQRVPKTTNSCKPR